MDQLFLGTGSGCAGASPDANPAPGGTNRAAKASALIFKRLIGFLKLVWQKTFRFSEGVPLNRAKLANRFDWVWLYLIDD